MKCPLALDGWAEQGTGPEEPCLIPALRYLMPSARITVLGTAWWDRSARLWTPPGEAAGMASGLVLPGALIPSRSTCGQGADGSLGWVLPVPSATCLGLLSSSP